MSQKSFSLVAGLIFLVVAVVHGLRVAIGWQVTFGGWNVPLWISWVAFVVAGFLAYKGLRLASHG